MTQAIPSLQARRQRETLLAISETAVEQFAAHGFSGVTVQDLARVAGVSVRTFHRYFPAKEDAVAPVLDAGWQSYVDLFDARPTDEPVPDALMAAFADAFDGPTGRRHRTFLRALPASPALEPIWLRVNRRCERSMLPPLARRLGLDPAGVRARYAAACVIDANRLAVEMWVERPRTTVSRVARECIDLVAAGLL